MLITDSESLSNNISFHFKTPQNFSGAVPLETTTASVNTSQSNDEYSESIKEVININLAITRKK